MTADIITLPVYFGRNPNVVRTSSATIILPEQFATRPPMSDAAAAIARGCPDDDCFTGVDSMLSNRSGDA